MRLVWTAMLALVGMAASVSGQAEPLLQLQGQPYFGGGMTLHLTGSVGQPALVVYGLDPLPLDAPLFTSKGSWYIGTMMNLVVLGIVPASGRLDLPFAMPPVMPGLAGFRIVMQGYVAPRLSNPAVLPFDPPYLAPSSAIPIASPQPAVQALFGDTWAVGDLDADGVNDLAVGAWFEDVAGIDKAGRVYILWGPTFSNYEALQSAAPVTYGTYGTCVVIADLTGDGIDDLVVAESPSDPPGPLEIGKLHIFHGGPGFSTVPSQSIESPGSGPVYTVFARTTTTGDYNGDGHVDLAVGGFKEVIAGQADAGRIDVYWGPQFSSMLSIPNPTPLESDFFGSALASADVNGDGIGDLIEGSGRADAPGVVNAGRVHVFVGPSLTIFQTIENPLPQGFNSRFGEQVHAADLNGDGRAEVIACDLKTRVYVYWSPDFGSYLDVRKPAALNSISMASQSFGYFLSSGDVNGDQLPDLMIADPFEGQANCGLTKEGTVFIALSPYFSTLHVLRNPLAGCGDEFGWRAALVDLDSDDISDLISGSDTADPGGVQNSGRVWILPNEPESED